MAELDTIELQNPTDEDFTHNYNGEAYTLKAGERKSCAKYVGMHLAKHLSSKMVVDEARKAATKKELEELSKPNSRFAHKLSQLNVYDTHERRIALYKILGDDQLVVQTILAYPFKGFVGDMNEYKKFIEKSQVKTK